MSSLKLPFFLWRRKAPHKTSTVTTPSRVLGRPDFPEALAESRRESPPQNISFILKEGPHALWSGPRED